MTSVIGCGYRKKDFVAAYKSFSISGETGTGMDGEAPEEKGASSIIPISPK